MDSPLEQSLEQYFGYKVFKRGQKDIIESVLAGRDVFGILPTGTGKSLCYQLPAKLLDGLTIVVTPLVSLMMDQVKQLQAMHYKGAAAINSFVDREERNRIYGQLKRLDLLYVSPELLQQPQAMQYLSNVKIALLVIDEAHCISQWGHEFRTDYMKLGEVARNLGNPQILALSATATDAAVEETIQILDRPNMERHIHPMDRENIALAVEHVKNDEEKFSIMSDWLKENLGPTIIYFSSRSACEDVAQRLIGCFPNQSIAFYHGGMEQTDRILVQQQFMNKQLDLICCTSAFGMGINKSDVRLVMHYHFPSDIESFIQEIGRAGRDGMQSLSVLLYSDQDIHLQLRLIESELPEQSMVFHAVRLLESLERSGRDEIGTGPEYWNLFQTTETQWRFLYYQFEKHGMIKDNRIMIKKAHVKEAATKIAEHVSSRLQFKKAKLGSMLDWLNEEKCLRVALYDYLQPTCTIPEINCCSHCGLDLDMFRHPEETARETVPHSWKEHLRYVLFNGFQEYKQP
ncbi:ATP-dependent DNA helicase RecQ [Aciduricibacillus chroicocephali]|uniref:ATP-dependent DNA helicase RecQ n=1 Tax=Aciduricibacillus chroicocephali TaxID=3054939 RepID=A0ABY9KUY6_9BACI|nr:ATP-dependent DNA helicase RecQ [Bacillaceae bacterium 44XB]